MMSKKNPSPNPSRASFYQTSPVYTKQCEANAADAHSVSSHLDLQAFEGNCKKEKVVPVRVAPMFKEANRIWKKTWEKKTSNGKCA